jgi:cytoskeletal protein CcmA (bactofilin family)
MFGSRKTPKKTETKAPRNQKQAPPSIISRDLNILGNLISDGTVDIDGRIEGNVKAAQVTVRTDGLVNGDVQADAVQIYGHVKGLIRAKDVHLHATARVEGSIMHEVLSMEEGAFVDGQFKRTDRLSLDQNEPALSGTVESEAVVPEEDQEEEVRLLENIRLISTNNG